MSRIPILESITEYSEKFSTPEDELLYTLNRETHVKTGRGVMLSGHMQGQFLKMFSQAVRPKRILEIGTFTGYSAICLAQGLQVGGALHTIDIDEELYDIAAKYWEAFNLSDRIIQHTGKAAEIIPTLDLEFDLVFIDADKVSYSNYYDLVFDKLKLGGFIIADNVLYDGEVVLPEDQQSKNARAMHEFNTKIKNDDRVEHFLMALRDGLMIARKK